MRVKIRPVIGCAVSVAAISMFSSMAVLAASDAEIEDAKWSFTAVANVSTQVNIRAGASTDSAIVGYLPKAATAEVIERGQEWTHVISGGVEGYIKDEFLAYGDEAKKLAGVYGTPGVEVSWDDVSMFSRPDCCSSVLKKAKGGSEYTLLEKEGAWYAVQMDDVTVAYVPAEDVQKTTILEKAIPVESTYGESDGTYTAANWQPEYAEAEQSSGAASDSKADSSYADTSAAGGTYETASNTYTDSTSADNTYADDSYTAADNSYSEPDDTDASAPSDSADAPSEETVTTASTDDVSLLAALIYCEAGNQSREGKVAVGAVVMNRIASSSYPGTIREVVYQSGQFSPAGSGWLDQVLASGAPSDCYEAAQAALNGENPVPGALYFNTSAGKGTKIGAHWFY